MSSVCPSQTLVRRRWPRTSTAPGAGCHGAMPPTRASRGPTRRPSAACPSAWLVLLLSALLLGISLPGRAASTQIDIDHHGATFEVQARAHVAAPLTLAWSTVTDYEALPA